jgi:predicted Kef-type K+ transport protein
MGLKQLLKSDAGQISIGSLIGIFIVIILFAALSPTLNYFVNNTVTALGAGTVAATIVQLWPLGMAIAILWAIFIYARPTYQQFTG